MTDFTLTNPSFDTAGKFGKRLLLDGAGNGVGNVPFGLQSGVNGVTMECWLSTNDTGFRVLWSQGDMWFGLNSGGVRTNSGSGTANVLPGDGTKHHFAAVFDVSETRYYIDGVLNYTEGAHNNSGANASTLGALGSGYYFNGSVDELAVFNTAKYKSNFTPPSSAYAGNESNLIHLYHFDGDGTDSAGTTPTTPVTIAYNNAALLYGPYNWRDNGTAMVATSCGAYVKFRATGTTLKATIVAPASVSPMPVVRAQVDNLSPVDVTLVAGQTTITFFDGNLPAGTHNVRISLQNTESPNGRWDETNTVKITAILLDAGASAGAPTIIRPRNMILFGDSITEGAGAGDHSILMGPLVAEAINAEYANIGFSSQGFAVGGYGGVPPLNSAYALHSSGNSRLVNGQFSPAPDYVASWHGTNGSPTQSDVATAISNFRTAAPNAWILMIVPPGGQARAAITAAVNAAITAGDTKVVLIDAGTGRYTIPYLTADGTHPIPVTHARFAAEYARQIQHAIEPRRFTVIAQ